MIVTIAPDSGYPSQSTSSPAFGICRYFSECTTLPDSVPIADHLGEELDDWTIEMQPCEPILETYVDGSRLMQCLFCLCLRLPYSDCCVNTNIRNLERLEAVVDWIRTQSAAGNLPDLNTNLGCIEATGPDGDTQRSTHYAESLEVLSSGYLLEEDAYAHTARYQIQCRVTYYERSK